LLEKLKIGNLFGNSKPTSEPVQQDIVGIDISHSYVRTIGLKKKNKKWSLHKISTKILDERYDTDAKRDEDIVNLLKTIKLEQRFETDNAAISLPVNAAIVQVIQIPYLDDKELKEATDNGSLWEASIEMPGDQSEYSIFWQTIRKDKEKNMLSLLFVASRIAEIEKNCDLVRRAGFDPLIVDVRCFALRNILKTYEESESAKTQVFLEISGTENYAVCMHDNLPFIYDIYVSDADTTALLEGGKSMTDELFDRLASQIRTSLTSFIKQSGVPGLERVQVTSSLSNADKFFDRLKKEIVEYKVEPIDPFSFVQIPPQHKDRVKTEKNHSSLSVALGLATRQLDVFGYYKFVTAVSNINLLPDREDRIKKEKKKHTSSSLMTKLTIISATLFVLTSSLYGWMFINYPSASEIAAMASSATSLQRDLNKQTQQYKDLTKWTKDSGEINSQLLDLSYATAFPRGSFVTGIKHIRADKSQITIRANDPGLSSDIMSDLSKKFANVELLSIKSPSGSDTLSTFEIAFEIK
jgi:type IV pilus assembly protein PilN